MKTKEVLTEDYYNKKRKSYRLSSIMWMIIAALYFLFVAITLHVEAGGITSSLVAVAISIMYSIRLDSLKENYILYKNKSEQPDGGYQS